MDEIEIDVKLFKLRIKFSPKTIIIIMSKNRSHNIARELEEMYSQTFSRLSTGWTLKRARQEVQQSQGSVSAKEWWKRRQEGATDEDIREFLNLNDLQRRMVVWPEMMFRYSYYLSCIGK